MLLSTIVIVFGFLMFPVCSMQQFCGDYNPFFRTKKEVDDFLRFVSRESHIKFIRLEPKEKSLYTNEYNIFKNTPKKSKYCIQIIRGLTETFVQTITNNSWDEKENYKIITYGLDKDTIPGFILLIKLPTKRLCCLEHDFSGISSDSE